MQEFLIEAGSYLLSLSTRVFYTIWLSTNLTLSEKIFLTLVISWALLTTPISIVMILLRFLFRFR
uniref:Putative P' protein n=1 Tax=Cytorhabdovirus fragariae TaxID=2676436 RepID=A0A650ACR8_9RHAB|nr:putative P' protein [Cytorhabdovirus fragariae]